MGKVRNFEYIADIYKFAEQKGWRIQNLNTKDRCNNRGAYKFVELSLVIPEEKEEKEDVLADTIREIENETEVTNTEENKEKPTEKEA